MSISLAAPSAAQDKFSRPTQDLPPETVLEQEQAEQEQIQEQDRGIIQEQDRESLQEQDRETIRERAQEQKREKWQGQDTDPDANQGYTPTELINRKSAPVVLDGQILFEVTSFQDITAQARAQKVSETLDIWATQTKVPDITVREGRGTTTIYLNDDDLITVTKSDAIRDLRQPKAQAEQWSQIIIAAISQAQTERNPEVLGRSIILAVVTLILAGTAFWRLGRLQRRISKKPLKQLEKLIQGKAKRDGIPIRARRVGIAIAIALFRYGLCIAALFYVTQLFPETRQGSYTLTRGILASFVTPIFPLGGEKYSLVDVLILMAVFLALVVGSTIVTNLLRTRILQLAGIGSGSQQAIATLIRYTLIALGTVVILQLWGLDLSSLTILAGALGVGIGFGFQNIARDFGSGLVLLFERPVQVGDFIEVGTFKGTVDRIGARSTTIKTLDQVSVIVPNSYFLDNQVVNWSHDNPLSRIAIPIGVSYKSDPTLVRKLLLQAGTAHPGILQIPAPQVLFKGFGDNALNFELLVWIVQPNHQPMIRSDLNFSVLELLREHQVEIPYPQRDLHIRTGNLPFTYPDTMPDMVVPPDSFMSERDRS